MSDPQATVIAAFITGLLSLTGTAVTAAVQLIDGEAKDSSARVMREAATPQEGLCIRLLDQVLDFVEVHSEDAKRSSFPRLYTEEESAACDYPGEKLLRTSPSSRR